MSGRCDGVTGTRNMQAKAKRIATGFDTHFSHRQNFIEVGLPPEGLVILLYKLLSRTGAGGSEKGDRARESLAMTSQRRKRNPELRSPDVNWKCSRSEQGRLAASRVP